MQKLIALYLPQFHPVKRNNEWWGEGFTEWRNVVKAKPRFSGHHQPQLPADLGYYDLRLAETREKQAAMAKQYGIHGFCYYHYWFNGELLLEQPVEEMLATETPDFPFCMCWANENWTRAWDGMEREVLIKQDYADLNDITAHVKYLAPYFLDSRYICVNGRPVFLIYRVDNIPEPKEYINLFRRHAADHGVPELHLVAVKNGFVELTDDQILSLGFDAIMDFQPNRNDFPKNKKTSSQVLVDSARKLLPNTVFQSLKVNVSAVNKIDYKQIVAEKTAHKWPTDYVKYPTVFPSWDNTARRKTPTVIQNNDPDDFRKWLMYAVKSTAAYDSEQQLIFINAWNEWAEGCHLEPDEAMGKTFLEITRSVMSSKSKL
ncbi:MAG TPA: glycoside hydrolase family 99-like domain-containing protein [Scandinavium sp.]|jgi:lipopolysaccharide biosynthesis protein|uniref:glycosyltransferase WbsX family protein n=1 Tax=Scandinavium sp. TaxID=2830653 RepID=UPI002E35D865|nr:glycoside hydrolase family 99-like domain-containing protein [Scandinavium sp.]HEX4500171.1 glycoside hydrolase family 99-like domain-containing protein [Scandinavium sp.]